MMNLKNAILISFVGHCIVLTPFGNFGTLFFQPSKKTNNIQITYCAIKPPPEQAAPIKVAAQSENKKIGRAAAKKRAGPKKHANVTGVKPQQAALPQKDNIEPASIPGTTLPNTPECVTYYQYIREEIKRWLERSYRPDYGEGDVVVSFELNRSGKLSNLTVAEAYSVDIPMLHRIAGDSIRFASPFKAFPEGLDQSQISFNLTIAFKKR